MKEIWVIEKAWIDSDENNSERAKGYALHSFVESQAEAQSIVEKGGHFTSKDCWAIRNIMPKYKGTRLNYFK